MKIEEQLHKSAEDQDPWYRSLARPLSKVYGFAAGVRHRRFDQNKISPRQLKQDVVSVGNLSVGGTGKSPVVISICQFLASRGRKPGVLTRGYGKRMPAPGWMAIRDDRVLFGTGNPPDEAAMEAAALDGIPIVIGPDRFSAAESFVAKFPEMDVDIWVMDDGFRHRQLHRDVDIVCADERQRFGNGELLPAGPLREPITSLARAQWLLWTRGTATGRAPAYDYGGQAIDAFSARSEFSAEELERIRALCQKGVDQLDRGEGIAVEDVDAYFEDIK